MTIKQLQEIMERAKREVAEEYKVKGNTFTLKDIAIIQERAKKEVDLEHLEKLNKIRKAVYDYNKEIGFYDIAGMSFAQFRRAMKNYSYDDQMKLSYEFFQHIKTLDNTVFDEEDNNEH